MNPNTRHRDDDQKKRDFSDTGSMSPPQGSKLGIASSDSNPSREQDHLGGDLLQDPQELPLHRPPQEPAEGPRDFGGPDFHTQDNVPGEPPRTIASNDDHRQENP